MSYEARRFQGCSVRFTGEGEMSILMKQIVLTLAYISYNTRSQKIQRFLVSLIIRLVMFSVRYLGWKMSVERIDEKDV